MEKLLIRFGQKIFFLDDRDIDFIEADRNYIRIHSGEKTYVMRQTLRYMEKKLADKSFMRVNRSVIVNTNRVKEIQVSKASTYEIVLNNDTRWILGRRFRHNLDMFLEAQIKV